MSGRTPVVLLVLDGWGYRPEREGNAIALSRTPTWDALWGRAPRTLLAASGLPVGLPEGQMGNSEVGHLNLGAGRVVMQDLVRISAAIADGSFYDNAVFVDACGVVKASGGTLHLLGLMGAGGVHGLDRHLEALVRLADRHGVKRVAIHAMMDGRDTLPKSGLGFMQETLGAIEGRARVASVGGRYYGMDRDKRWARTGGGGRRRPDRRRPALRHRGGVRSRRDRRVHDPDGDRRGWRAGRADA
jgi:2,3-bisphosphoglycerate-independent phosphoglycerate mutase